MKYFIIFLLILFFSSDPSISQNKSKSKKKVPETSTQKQRNDDRKIKEEKLDNSYSGVYEGKIDFELCCASFGEGNGYIAFDFSEEPFKILYDGVLWEHFSLENNLLKDLSEYSEYPNNIIGVFENKNGNQGFWYNFRSSEGDGSAGKSFLRKTGNISIVKELINKASDEKNKFDEFWIKFKNAIIEKDFQTLSTYAKYPVIDKSELINKYGLNKTIRNSQELINRFKLIFTNDFYLSNKDWDAFRQEDHYPDNLGGKYMFMPNVFIIIEKISDDFKITEIVGPWG